MRTIFCNGAMLAVEVFSPHSKIGQAKGALHVVSACLHTSRQGPGPGHCTAIYAGACHSSACPAADVSPCEGFQSRLTLLSQSSVLEATSWKCAWRNRAAAESCCKRACCEDNDTSVCQVPATPESPRPVVLGTQNAEHQWYVGLSYIGRVCNASIERLLGQTKPKARLLLFN